MARDYRAEEARRNELARQRGYTSRAQERRARAKASAAPRPTRTASARQRDYKAEEKRRNELARLRGFTSRAQERRARSKAPTTPRRAPKSEYPREALTGTIFTPSMEAQAWDWSDIHAGTAAARFDPDNRPDGISRDEYGRAYFDAFVGPTGYNKVVRSHHDTPGPRLMGDDEALRHWFVDILGWEPEEYDSKYRDT